MEGENEEQICFLEGNLHIPKSPQGIVIFAHASGSSRDSKRNQYVARKLNEDGLATLLFDLLTAQEEKIDNETREHRFDIGLLSKRLVSAIDRVANIITTTTQIPRI